jgi:hypothetical protein
MNGEARAPLRRHTGFPDRLIRCPYCGDGGLDESGLLGVVEFGVGCVAGGVAVCGAACICCGACEGVAVDGVAVAGLEFCGVTLVFGADMSGVASGVTALLLVLGALVD